jgi:polyisoprenoid-binding protein YceI/rhodanese-related sulfurtransferase
MVQSYTPINASSLEKLLAGPRPPVLVDVRLEEDYHGSHLPHASNNCVYEIVFLERMPAVAPDLEIPICVYGAHSGSLESRMAAEKLCRHGYKEVYDFRDGLQGWRSAGFVVEGSPVEAATTPIVSDGTHLVDLTESHVRWIGRNLLKCHEGLIGLKSGSLQIESGELVGGEITIDMQAITCLDLTGNPLHDVLVRHLRDHDFFDATLYPEATFVVTRAIHLPDSTPGSLNLSITGTLTLKGVSATLEFQACAGITAAGKLAAQATLAFDRTLWNVLYGSGKWFRHLGGNLVNDLIEIQLRVISA